MSRTLRPILHRDAYTQMIAREVNAWFAEAIFAPLQIVLRDHSIPLLSKFQAIRFDEFGRENAAESELRAALREGQVFYSDGVFGGKFSAEISRELRDIGGRFDRSSKVWRIPESRIPADLRGALAQAVENSKAANQGVLNVLRATETNIAAAKVGLRLTRRLDAIFADIGKQFAASVTSISPEEIGIRPQLDTGTREILERKFTSNLELSIKDFASERIPELRRRVEENVFQFGARNDRLAKIIEAEFGVSRRKAEFLADQETGLLVANYRRAKYEQIGIKQYVWSTSHDNRVRHSHRILDGKTFTFGVGANVAEPGEPARYCDPGEDFRCRCVPIPKINLQELAA